MKLRETWQNWRLYGLPRCDAYDFDTHRPCNRLMWPWQEIGGNGERARHAACQRQERASLARFDAERVA